MEYLETRYKGEYSILGFTIWEDAFVMKDGYININLYAWQVNALDDQQFFDIYNGIPQEEYIKALLRNHAVAVALRKRQGNSPWQNLSV